MGDNATASWAWHNTVVGQGYQAKGVVRQPGSNPVKVLDLRVSAQKEQTTAPTTTSKYEQGDVKEDMKKSKRKRKDVDESRDQNGRKRKSKKVDKKEKKEKKHKKKKSNSNDKSDRRDLCPLVSNIRDNFNPLLQYLATCLSNRTRLFSLTNE